MGAEPTDPRPSLLTEHETQTLILALLIGRANGKSAGRADEDEIAAVLNHADDARWGSFMIDQILAGEVMVDVKDGKLFYAQPTPEYKARLEGELRIVDERRANQ